MALNSQKKWKEISRLVLSPRSRDIKRETYSSFIVDILSDAKKNVFLNIDDIIKNISIKYALKDFSPLITKDSLEALRSSGLIQKEKGGYILSDNYRKKIEAEKLEIRRTHEAMLYSFVKEVQKIYGSQLDKYQISIIKDIFENSLYEVFENIGQKILTFIEEKKDPIETVIILSIIEKNANVIDEQIIDNFQKIKTVLPEAIKNLFSNPSDVFSKGLLECSSKHVMLRILGIDPELKKYRAELFRGTNILLDTNIIIANLCEGSTRHKYTTWILENTKVIGVNILISDYTINEYADAVDFADRIYTNSLKGNIHPKLFSNEITKTYYENINKYTDWKTYNKIMKEGTDIFIKKWDANIITSFDYDINLERIEVLKDIIRSIDREIMKDRFESVVEHDVINILLIQAMRDKIGKAPFNSPWFITHDASLKRADEVMRKQYKFNQVSCISCDAWFELIYPFIWIDVNPSDAAKTFTNLVATNVLPIKRTSTISFVNYISDELDLSAEDTNKLKTLIEESHLRKSLESSLERGDIPSTLDILEKIVSDGIETRKIIEKQSVIITNLTKKITELQSDIEITNFHLGIFQTHLKKIENAKTNNDKKKTLESFAAYFASLIQGWTVHDTNIIMNAEEIDLMIENNLYSNKWGDPILIECKNWSKPVGKDEIVLFIDKLKLLHCSVGILIAKNGITGTEKADAGLRVREALWKEGLRVIILTIDDLKSMINGEIIKDILKSRYYNPTKLLRE